MRALRHITTDRAHVLGIAARAVECGRIDRDRRASCLLRRSIAARAHGHGDLELRAAGRFGARVRRAVEHRIAQRRDQLIVVEERAALAGERGTDLAQACEHLGAELEPHHVRARRRSGRSVESVGLVTAAEAATRSSISRTFLPAAASRHRVSVSGVATRVSSRTAKNASSPRANAPVSAGSSRSARATRSRSFATCGV
jgi:hypothetical protein